MSDWQFSKLGDVVENKSRRFDFSKFEDVVFINTGDVLEGSFLHHDLISKVGLPGQAKKAIQKGDILYSEIRPANKRFAKVEFDAPNYVVSTKFMVLSMIRDDVDLEFLYLILTANQYLQQFQRIAESRSGTFPQITFDAISYLPINLPPLPEQKAIAHILGRLDDKIELNRQMNRTLEAMAQALFKSWFVDFDPVIDNALAAGHEIPEPLQAKAEKRQAILDRHSALDAESPQNGAPLLYTNPELAKQFPNSFSYNETLGKWIPEGWEVKTINDVATVVGGGTPSTKVDEYYTENGIPWLSPKDLSGYEWKYISKGAKDITELGLQKSSAKMLPAETVVFSSRAPIGYLAIAENDLCTNQGFKSLVPEKGVPTEYLFQFLKANTDLIDSVASGSTFKEVSGSAIKGLDILIPNKELLDNFSSILGAGNKRSLINQKETDTLTKLRDTLLPQLISGKIRVPGNGGEG